jgi:hypothetical protein
MIRPASEIEYPPSQAMCLKARMIARMEGMAESTDTIVATIAQRFGSIDPELVAELQSFEAEQKRLVENMKRIVRG